MNSIKQVVNEPMDGHEEYHLMVSVATGSPEPGRKSQSFCIVVLQQQMIYSSKRYPAAGQGCLHFTQLLKANVVTGSRDSAVIRALD